MKLLIRIFNNLMQILPFVIEQNYCIAKINVSNSKRVLIIMKFKDNVKREMGL
jgi:hypothetical protein